MKKENLKEWTRDQAEDSFLWIVHYIHTLDLAVALAMLANLSYFIDYSVIYILLSSTLLMLVMIVLLIYFSWVFLNFKGEMLEAEFIVPFNSLIRPIAYLCTIIFTFVLHLFMIVVRKSQIILQHLYYFSPPYLPDTFLGPPLTFLHP